MGCMITMSRPHWTFDFWIHGFTDSRTVFWEAGLSRSWVALTFYLGGPLI